MTYAAPEQASLSEKPPLRGDRALARYYRWLPVLWFCGIDVLVMLALTARLALRRWPTGTLINVIFLAWMLVSMTQALSVLYNWSVADLPLTGLAINLLKMTVVGWTILGLGMAVGYGSDLASPTAVRGTMRLALWIIGFGTLGLLLGMVTGLDKIWLQTPMRLIVGPGRGSDFYLLAKFYVVDDGVRRVILFFPWATALSLGGICLILIATCERDVRWRIAGYLGGIFAVIFSYSRMGYVALPVALCVPLAWRAGSVVLLCGLALTCTLALAITIMNIDVVELIQRFIAEFHSYRAGSSLGREWIYEASWRAFLRSPYFGWGWVGPSIISEEVLPIGSHSTFFGTLYTGGLTTFVALVVAASLTFLALLWRAVSHPSDRTTAALGVYVACLLFSFSDSFYSLVPPLLFALFFIGGTLAAPDDSRE